MNLRLQTSPRSHTLHSLTAFATHATVVRCNLGFELANLRDACTHGVELLGLSQCSTQR